MLDDRLLLKVTQGDKGALDELVASYYPAVFQYCRFHTRNIEEAEDATQQVFVNFFSNFSRYAHQGKMKAYLFSIARNHCINIAAKLNPVQLPEETPYVEPGLGDTEAEHDFLLLLEPLPTEQRELIVLRYANGLKMREISEVTGTPMRTVQSRLRTALKRIKKQMEGSNEKWF